MKTQVFIPVEPKVHADSLKSAVIDKFGGYTAFPANGAWRMPDGSVCIEPVEIVEVFTPNQDRQANEAWFFAMCRQYGLAARQDAVLVVHGDEPVFIETKAAA